MRNYDTPCGADHALTIRAPRSRLQRNAALRFYERQAEQDANSKIPI